MPKLLMRQPEWKMRQAGGARCRTVESESCGGRRKAITARIRTSTRECSHGLLRVLRSEGLCRLSPALQARPQAAPRIELLAPANENVNLLLQRIGTSGGSSNIVHMLPESFEGYTAIVENDHAVTRVVSRSPEKPRLMAAQRSGQVIAAAEKIDSPGLAVILCEDAAVRTLLSGKAVPGDRRFVHNLLPAELVGIPLRQCRPSMGVFHDRQLERESLCIFEESVGGKHRNNHWSQMCT